MARYASFCFIMSPFNYFTACMPDFSGMQKNTARISAGNYPANLYCIYECTPWLVVYCLTCRKQLVWLCLGYCSMITVTTVGVACHGH